MRDPSPAQRAPIRLLWQARQAAGATASGIIGALMFGPSTIASPHQAIASFGSAFCAAWKARCASAWLNAKAQRMPWSK
jgi:hypothetical protein